MPKLHFVHPDGTEARFALEGDVFRIGRAPDNDIVLSDARVSSHHLLLQRTSSGNYMANDLGATNPTRINGRVITLHELRDGDTLWIGDTYARYENPPAQTPGRPARGAVGDAAAGSSAQGCFALLLAAGVMLVAAGVAWAAG